MRNTTLVALGAIGLCGASIALAQTAPILRPIPMTRMAPAAAAAAPDPRIDVMQAELTSLQARLAQDEKTIGSLKTQLTTVAGQYSITKSDVLVLNGKTDATNEALGVLRNDFAGHKHFAYFEGPDPTGTHSIIKYAATTLVTSACTKTPGQTGMQVWKCTGPE